MSSLATNQPLEVIAEGEWEGLTRSQWGQRILFYVVFTPPPPSHHGIAWVLPVISLVSTLVPLMLFSAVK